MNKELELYKLIMTPEVDDLELSYVDEFGWVCDAGFCLWVIDDWWSDFLSGLVEIFGSGLFDDGGIDAKIQEDRIFINLSEVLDGYDIDLECAFPKDKFLH